MKVKRILLLLFLLLPLIGVSQPPELSPISKISVLTCGPGDQLYSTFGHSAFRVQDRSLGIDVVYNYGVFDFRTKNFYGKFAMGKLDYSLARQQTTRFLQEYKYENRWVNEQVLQLNQQQRNELFGFLETNYLPENRAYKYDFFYNNCATKVWDVLNSVFGDQLVFNDNYLDETFTHRELIRKNVATNTWSAFGIDLALGSVIDDQATPKEHMFLPIYVMKQLATAKLGSSALLAQEKALVKAIDKNSRVSFLTTPLFWSIVLFLFVLTVTIFDFKKGKRSKWLDFILFFITGVAGTVIFFLWFVTDHTATAGNFNILWTLPFNLFLSFLLLKTRVFTTLWNKIFIILLLLILLFFILWTLGIQIFSPVTIPFILALTLRYIYLYNQSKTIKN